MFWMASDSAKTSRLQPRSADNGARKSPMDDLGPKLIIAIRQPQATMTRPVRQSMRGAEVFMGFTRTEKMQRRIAVLVPGW